MATTSPVIGIIPESAAMNVISTQTFIPCPKSRRTLAASSGA
jgi:hypothetical protein